MLVFVDYSHQAYILLSCNGTDYSFFGSQTTGQTGVRVVRVSGHNTLNGLSTRTQPALAMGCVLLSASPHAACAGHGLCAALCVTARSLRWPWAVCCSLRHRHSPRWPWAVCCSLRHRTQPALAMGCVLLSASPHAARAGHGLCAALCVTARSPRWPWAVCCSLRHRTQPALAMGCVLLSVQPALAMGCVLLSVQPALAMGCVLLSVQPALAMGCVLLSVQPALAMGCVLLSASPPLIFRSFLPGLHLLPVTPGFRLHVYYYHLHLYMFF